MLHFSETQSREAVLTKVPSKIKKEILLLWGNRIVQIPSLNKIHFCVKEKKTRTAECLISECRMKIREAKSP